MSSESENIQVVVRCRGRNAKETSTKSPVVVHVADEEGDEVVVNPSDDTGVAAQLNSKTYRFDKVFGPVADQQAIFGRVASPLFDEFLKGYNCTLLVYGMTSTGKTYTMSGENKIVNGELSEKAGIIPRIILKLFKVLEEAGDSDYIVKCSFVELYNEELKDLLSDDLNKKLRIFDQKNSSSTDILSQTSGNKSAIHIQNLEEVVLQNAAHGLKTLQKGLKLRQVAATKMNDVSSRSHTIFTLNLFKQNKDSGDLFRISKMNMVDLAGSENISRSGALNQRAKEAGSINQSLLTLGRVINLLVEKTNQHIPYRESKLTRLLQDSLGGRTKTCLIATISPAKINYDETLSTLEYANKAKSIQNKPQLGSTLARDILLKELSAELAKVKSDLSSTRMKDGIYMDNDNYQELVTDLQESKTTIEESVREQEVLKKQNEFLKAQLKESEAQSIQHITLINTLNSTIESLHNKIDQQKENEKNLMSSSTKFKTIINTINEKITSLKQFEIDSKAVVTDVIVSHLTPVVKEVAERLQESSKVQAADVSVIESQLSKLSKALIDSASDLNKKVDSALAQLPEKFSQIDTVVSQLETSVSAFENALNERFSRLSKENNDFKNSLTDSLFQNHNHIVKDIVSQTNQKLEDDANELLNQFIDLIRENNNKQQSLVVEQIKLAVEKSMTEETKHLEPMQKKWDESARGIINSCDSLAHEFQSRHNTQLKSLSNILEEGHTVVDSTKKTVDGELNKLPGVVENFETSKEIRTSINSFKEDARFKKQLLATLSTSNASVLAAQEKLNKKVVQMAGVDEIDEQDMNKIVHEIELEQAEMKKKLLPTGKTPKREPLQLPTQDSMANRSRSPPKFQLIGQRFQDSENQVQHNHGPKKRKSDDDLSAKTTKLPKLSTRLNAPSSRVPRRR